ncbi:MAG: hypothetical protein Q8O56_06310 [Solirubrobacteraceae bacterium]|nr:hypothetical protein [Solirubrobacteraceae bacterium]
MTTRREPSDPVRRCRQLIAELELISQAPAMNLEPTRPGSDAKGGNRPPGGIDRRDDREPDHPLKSHEHFRRRLHRCRSTADYEALAADAEAALHAWQHAPPPPKDSLAWKDLIAADHRPAKDVATAWDISASYVYQLRRRRQQQEAA